jgi:hypothetical protein
VRRRLASANLDRSKQDLRVQVMVGPGKDKPEFRMKSLPGLEARVHDAVGEAIAAVPLPPVKGAPVALEFLFGIWGGTGTLKILE